MEEKLLTTREAAEFLRCSKQKLDIDRHLGRGYPFCRVSGRGVRYRLSDLMAALEATINERWTRHGKVEELDEKEVTVGSWPEAEGEE